MKVQERLEQEFIRRKMSVRELLELTGLPIDRSTMHRKIHGDSQMSLDEADAIAAALGKRLIVARAA